MRTFVVDTSAIYAYVYQGDVNYQRIHAFIQQHGRNGRFLLSNYVFDETMTLLKSHFGAETAVRAGQMLRDSQLFQLVYLTAADEQATWDIFQRYLDKRWSYTDCACLALLRRLGIQDAIAFDRHFHQMGVIVHPQ